MIPGADNVNSQWWKNAEKQITTYGAKWGGEVAASAMTGCITPQDATVYLEAGDGATLFKDHRFRKDRNGDIHVYRAFWQQEEAINALHTNLVHPLVAYADLVGTGGVRNLEAPENQNQRPRAPETGGNHSVRVE